MGDVVLIRPGADKPEPCIRVFHLYGRYRVSVLWGPGGGHFATRAKALACAAALHTQRGWAILDTTCEGGEAA